MRASLAKLFLTILAIAFSATVGGMPFEAEWLVTVYEDETSRTPRSITPWIELSDAYLWWGELTDNPEHLSKAERAATRALDLDATDLDALHQMARVRYAQHKYGEVVRLEATVLDFRPLRWRSWGTLGDALMKLGKYRSADSCYYRMYQISEEFCSLTRVARSAFELRDFEEAIEQLDRAIEHAETARVPMRDLAAGHIQLAEIYFAHGYWEAAMENVDKSLSYVSNAARALALKTEILRLDGRYEESRIVGEHLCRLSTHPRYKAMLARTLKAQGKSARSDSLVQMAATEFELWAREYPEATDRCRAAFLLEWDIDVDEALRIAYQTSRNRRDVYGYELLAWAYLKTGKYDLAWSCISLALRKGPKIPRLFYRAAVIAKAAGKIDKYDAFAEKSRQMNPRLEQVYGPL